MKTPVIHTSDAVPGKGAGLAAGTTTSGAAAAPACGTDWPHESAQAQVSGQAQYIDDVTELRGTLHAAPIMSPVAHGRLLAVDGTAALALPGVVTLVLAQDIPGHPVFPTPAHDETIFATDTVQHVGQVIGLVVADSMALARQAASQVRCRIEPLPAILTIDAALQAQSYVLPPVTVRRGDAAAAMATAPLRLDGQFDVGGQEHFYLEGQIAYAMPGEQHGWRVLSSTQHPGEVQHWVAHALGLAAHDVTVECRRMGGGFGGKETQAGHLAVWAALAAQKTGRPVKMRLDRDDDFEITGKRHNFHYRYSVGFDAQGRLLALQLMLAGQCGFSADLSAPVNDRAIFHADNAYFLENVEIVSYRLKTNTQSNTAFRGFGGPQGMIAIETILEEVARATGLDPLDVRRINFYRDGRDVTHYQMKVEDNIVEPLVAQLEKTSRYRERRDRIRAWNAGQPVLRRGLALTPVKFGISFTATLFNQAGALVNVYTDGSVLVNHGGTEMGQGLHTKVCQIVADELGVPYPSVRISASDTSKVPNASATAASAGTDLNGRAAQFAARVVRERLLAFAAARDRVDVAQVTLADGLLTTPVSQCSFAQLVSAAYAARIQLWSDGFYKTPKIHYDKTTLTGRPFYYFAYGAACTEVVIDTLTGESRVLAVDILHDAGSSINPAIDLGQIEGGFIQGMGWLTTEELKWNEAGRLTTHAPSTYKIPATGDLPARFKVDFWDAPNQEDNVHGSKAVGEPPFMLAISVYEAMRDAVGCLGKGPVMLDAPATAPAVLAAVTRIRGQ